MIDNRANGRPMGPPKTLSELREWHQRLVDSNMYKAATTRRGAAFVRKAAWHRQAVETLTRQIDAVDHLERIANRMDRALSMK